MREDYRYNTLNSTWNSDEDDGDDDGYWQCTCSDELWLRFQETGDLLDLCDVCREKEKKRRGIPEPDENEP